MKSLQRALKYTWISMRVIIKAGKAKVFLWVIALILPPVIELLKSITNSKMIDGVVNLWNGGKFLEPLTYCGLLILLYAGHNIFEKIQSRTFWILGQAADEHMMLYMMEKTSELKQINFDSSKKFSNLKDSVGSELSLWNLNANLFDLLTTIIAIIGTILIIQNFSIKLMGIAILFSFPHFFISNYLIKLDAESNVNSRREERVLSYYSELLTSARTAKELRIFGMQDDALSRWYDNRKEFNNRKQKLLFRQWRVSLILTAVEVLYFALVYFICAQSVVAKEISIGAFYLYTSNLVLLYKSFIDISETIRNILNISREYDVFEKFAAETKEGERTGSDYIFKEKVTIRFENVSFRYDDKFVLNNVSFEWKAGEKIALIGRNGSGKTTLLKLICGLYECDDGAIYINDINVKMYSQSDLYRLFGILYQDYCRYQLPLRIVIASQRLDAANCDNELWSAFTAADCDEFKEEFTCGLDTPLGREYDDGVELSGGQWQKIAVSRNYFGNRTVLIFDEPSSALDPRAEYRVIQNMLFNIEEIKHKSILVTSHRLSVGKLVDKILFLENGRIAEQGTHDELMKLNGKYAQMYATQAKHYTN